MTLTSRDVERIIDRRLAKLNTQRQVDGHVSALDPLTVALPTGDVAITYRDPAISLALGDHVYVDHIGDGYLLKGHVAGAQAPDVVDSHDHDDTYAGIAHSHEVADLFRPYGRRFLTDATASIPHNTVTKVNAGTAHGTDFSLENVAGTLEFIRSRVVTIHAAATFAASSNGTYRRMEVRLNNNPVVVDTKSPAGPGLTTTCVGSVVTLVTAGDTLEMFVRHNDGGSLNVTGGGYGGFGCWMGVIEESVHGV